MVETEYHFTKQSTQNFIQLSGTLGVNIANSFL